MALEFDLAPFSSINLSFSERLINKILNQDCRLTMPWPPSDLWIVRIPLTLGFLFNVYVLIFINTHMRVMPSVCRYTQTSEEGTISPGTGVTVVSSLTWVLGTKLSYLLSPSFQS